MQPYQASSKSTVKLYEGLESNSKYLFVHPRASSIFYQGDKRKGELQIKKEETQNLTYKLAISYLGVDKDKDSLWEIKINRIELKHEDYLNDKFHWSCKAIAFKPYGENSIQITLKNHKDGIQKFWVNISEKSTKPFIIRNSFKGVDD